MPSFSKRFKSRPPDYGAEFDIIQTGAINSLVPTAVTQYVMGNLSDAADTDKTKSHKGYIDEFFAACFAVPAGSGNILLLVKKRDVAAAATRQLVTNFDLKTLVGLSGKRIPIDAGVSDKDRTMQAGDVLYIEINVAGTVTTQPLINFSALIALLT